jgi:hypothetical protein
VQHIYACTKPECPVLTFVDNVSVSADPKEAGTCPSFDEHPRMTNDGTAVLIDKDY